MSKYPTIAYALHVMAIDQGLDKHPINLKDYDYTVDGGYVHLHTERYDGPIVLDSIERCLKRLSTTDLEELVIGSEENWKRLYNRCSRNAETQSMLHAFLEEMFAQCGG